MPNLSRGIMLEGISCAGKTSVMYALKRLFAADLTLERNIVMLGEHYTQVLNSIGGEFRYHDRQEHTDMLFGRVGMIEQLYEWACCLGEYRRASRGLYTVFERGLVNHVGFFQDYADPDILELIERLANLGIDAILLVVPDHLIEERLWLREKQMNRTEPDAHRAELAEKYKKQQDDMLFAVKKMRLPSRIICSGSMDWDAYAKTIVYGESRTL